MTRRSWSSCFLGAGIYLEIITLILIIVICQGAQYEATTAVLAMPTTHITMPERPLRLPNATFPVHYHLHIRTNIHRGELQYHGNVTIDIDVKESTDEIVLHAKRLSNFSINVWDLETGMRIPDLTHSFDQRGHFLIIHAIEYYQVFEVDKKYRLEILYSANMNEKQSGLYWCAYHDDKNQTVYIAATQFEPTSARLAMPCFDEPGFKANFSIKITHGQSYNAISNMQIRHMFNHTDDDLTTTVFYTTPLISTYLVAFVISNFNYISEEYHGLQQRVFTPSSSKNKGEEQLEFAIRLVAAYEHDLDIDYPLAKLDHVALNKNLGAAMENWGLITYREDCLLFGKSDNLRARMKDSITIAHEVVHQWFGNLVTPEWWTYTWLSEGFATYFSYLVLDKLSPELNIMEFFLFDSAERAYSYNDYVMHPHPITTYVEKEQEISDLFDTVIYQKSACVIKMFDHALNRNTFLRGIQLYLKKYQYKVANELDLVQSLQTAIRDEDEGVFKVNRDWLADYLPNIIMSWTHTKWIPIVSVQRNYEDNTVTIRQRSKSANSQEHWWIPLSFASASDNNFNQTIADYFMPPLQEVTLNASTLGIQLKPNDWLIVNKQQTGFYQVLYDDENLRKIALGLQENHNVIHVLNRADIFRNIEPIIEHNKLESIDVIFELLKYLSAEESYLVWNYAQPLIELLEQNLYGSDAYEPYKQFIRSIIEPSFSQFSQNIKKVNAQTEVEVMAWSYILRIACLVELSKCLEQTRQLAFDYIFENNEVVPNKQDFYEITESVLCSAFRHLSTEEFNAIQRIVSQPDASTTLPAYDDVLYALICLQDPYQIRQYIDMMIGTNATQYVLNNSNKFYLMYLYKNNMGSRDIVWEYMENNYKTLTKLPIFFDIFNRLAEYVPGTRRQKFADLHAKVTEELSTMGEEYTRQLININSARIGNKVRVAEEFSEKFSNDIYKWLTHNQKSNVYTAESMSVPTNSSPSRFEHIFKIAGNFIRQFF